MPDSASFWRFGVLIVGLFHETSFIPVRIRINLCWLFNGGQKDKSLHFMFCLQSQVMTDDPTPLYKPLVLPKSSATINKMFGNSVPIANWNVLIITQANNV